MKKAIALLATLTAFAIHAQEETSYTSGNDLAQWIAAGERASRVPRPSTNNEILDSLQLSGLTYYLRGVADQAALTKSVCIPSKTTVAQLSELTNRTLKENPEHWKGNGAFFVFKALTRAFPCAEK